MHTFFLIFALMLPQDIATYPVVNEVFYDTEMSPTEYDEWVEIYNPTASAWNLTNHKLGDEETNGGGEGMYLFPDGTYIAATSYIIVCRRDTDFFNAYGFHADLEFTASEALVPDMIKYSSWATGSFALGNSGDEVLLLDDSDNPVDVVVYEGGSYSGVTPHGGVPEAHSIERSPPGEDTEDCSVDMVDRDPETPTGGGVVYAPVISSVWREPLCPLVSEKATVSATITDEEGLLSETIWYSINGGAYSDVSMVHVGGDEFQGEIPEQTDGSHIRYFVVAIDIDALADTSETEGYFSGLTAIDSLRFNDGEGVPLYFGHAIRVTGLITVESHTFQSTSHIVNIQNNGIGVVAKSTIEAMPEVNVGDSITVCGTISQWNGQTRILCPDDEVFVMEELDKRAPDIYVREYTDFADEVGDNMDYEGLLVGLINAEKNSGAWGSPGTSFSIWLQEFEAAPPDLVEMWVDSDTDIDDNPEPTWPRDVVGVYSQYDNTLPYWSGYEIMPRSYDDFSYDLPVQLTGFSATAHIGSVLLTWRIECEKNAYVYEIRRAYYGSVGCDNAEVIGEVIAKGNSSAPQTYDFTDTQVNPGKTYYYWLIGITTDGHRTISGPVVAATGTIVMSVSTPNPNPFNQSTAFCLSSAYELSVDVSVYDISGRHIKTLFASNSFKGKRTISWNGLDKNGCMIGEGVYFIRNQVGGKEVAKKVLFVR